jgi:hypothetical protein
MDIETLVQQTILNTALMPKTPAEKKAWLLNLNEAYTRLAINHDFQLILEAWIITTLLLPCESPEAEGERRFVLHVLEAVANSVQYQQFLLGAEH